MKTARALAAVFLAGATALIGALPAGANPVLPWPGTTVPTTTVNSIPVLLYHGVAKPNQASANDDETTYDAFVQQMAALAEAGYETISPEEYTAWVQGQAISLPAKPFLMTFDDNRITAEPARQVVQAFGFRPVMYVVSGFAEGGYGKDWENWSQVNRLQDEGWYLQVHAGPCGHAYLLPESDPYNCLKGATITGDAKIGHRYYPQPLGQTQAQHKSRVTTDLDKATDAIAAKTGQPEGWESATFAVPWDDWGQPETSNQTWLSQLFAARYPVVFLEESYPGSSTAKARNFRYRYQVNRDTTVAQVMSALNRSEFSR